MTRRPAGRRPVLTADVPSQPKDMAAAAWRMRPWRDLMRQALVRRRRQSGSRSDPSNAVSTMLVDASDDASARASFRTQPLGSARMRVRLALMARAMRSAGAKSRAAMFGLPPKPTFARRSGRSLGLIVTPGSSAVLPRSDGNDGPEAWQANTAAPPVFRLRSGLGPLAGAPVLNPRRQAAERSAVCNVNADGDTFGFVWLPARGYRLRMREG
jgi:hypothetical protein